MVSTQRSHWFQISKIHLIDLIINPLSLPWIQFRTYVLMKNTGLFHLNESGICGYPTVVILLRHEHVAVIAPVGRPGVLNKPVSLAVHGTVTNGEHRMV